MILIIFVIVKFYYTRYALLETDDAECLHGRLLKKGIEEEYSSSLNSIAELHLLPQCYLPPDTSEHTLP